jgi:monolysocardiolipin acyltransferase
MSRGFLYGLNRMEVVGLDRFLEALDKREDVDGRERGLITGLSPSDAWDRDRTDGIHCIVSNHVSVYVQPSAYEH